MKIVILDKAAMGLDTPIDVLYEFGDVVSFDESNNDEAVERSSKADIIILNKVRVTRELMTKSKNLKLICVFATGYDNIDIQAARELGIGVCNVPGYSTDSVTLYTLSTVLALCSHIMEYNRFVRTGEYSDSGIANRLTPVYHELSGKTWGIIGYGNIGRSVARVARALGAHVIYNKRTPSSDHGFVDIDTLCRESDIITIHCPLNDDSRGLINKERILTMKKDVILVNEARGAVLDEEAIANAVEEGRIAGFGCDVYSTEPFGNEHPFYRIKDRNNVILTPHCAWGSYEARVRCISIIAENIKAYREQKILNRVDK